MEARAAGIVMLDLSWCGGLSEAKKIATMAEAYHLPVAPHDCTGPVVLAASTHLSCNAPNALIQESVRAFYTGWYKELVTALPEVKDGMIAPPPGPGLGLDLLPDITRRKDAVVRSSVAGVMLELTSPQLRLAVRPEIGAAVARFDWLGEAGPVPVLRPWDGAGDDPNRHGLLSAGAVVEPDLGRRDRGRRAVLAAAAQLAGRALSDPRRRLATALDAWRDQARDRGRAGAGEPRAAAFAYRAELDLRLAGATASAWRLSVEHHGGDARSLRPGLPPLVPAHTRNDAARRRGDRSGWRRRPPAGRQRTGRRPAGLGFRARAAPARGLDQQRLRRLERQGA